GAHARPLSRHRVGARAQDAGLRGRPQRPGDVPAGQRGRAREAAAEPAAHQPEMSPTDPDTLAAIAPGAAPAALAVGLMPWLSRGDSRVRAVVVAITMAFTLRYMWWRITATLPALDGSGESIACLLFLIAEVTVLVGTTITILFLGRVRNRSAE